MNTLACVRAGWGAALVCAPRVALMVGPAGGLDRPARHVSRILGARLLAQAGFACTRRGSERRMVLAGATVDALHAASMVLLAARVPRYRRIAIGNAAGAALLAVAGLRHGRAM